ncbi:hypothetical protein HOY80DRAFT_983232 [Tuber brumale]|nr:hypothetical protein HOY80DRAFT_983232 [Tuber brumale]
MSAPEASENTGLLGGPSTSTPIPGEHGNRNTLIGILANLAFLISAFGLPFFSYYAPNGGKAIFEISYENPTWFTIRHEFVIIYWFILLFFQTKYLSSFFCNTGVRCQTAARLGIFFILHNILIFVWAFLSIHSLFKWGELLLFLNFIQLCVGCGVDRERVSTCPDRCERVIAADQENQGNQEDRDWQVEMDEFRYIDRLAVLSLPLILTVYMLPWNIAIDFACQEGICGIATANILFLFVYGLVFMRGLRDFSIGLASTFFDIGLLVQQWDNPNRWYFWSIVANAAAIAILSIFAAGAQHGRGSGELGRLIRAVLNRFS